MVSLQKPWHFFINRQRSKVAAGSTRSLSAWRAFYGDCGDGLWCPDVAWSRRIFWARNEGLVSWSHIHNYPQKLGGGGGHLKCIEYRLIDDLNWAEPCPGQKMSEVDVKNVVKVWFLIFSHVARFIFFSFFRFFLAHWKQILQVLCDRFWWMGRCRPRCLWPWRGLRWAYWDCWDCWHNGDGDQRWGGFPPVRWSRLCFYGKVFSEKNINIYIK